MKVNSEIYKKCKKQHGLGLILTRIVASLVGGPLTRQILPLSPLLR